MTLTDTHAELVDQLDQHVRERVRREGVDPQRDATMVRRIAEGVVSDHDERSLTGAVIPVPNPESVVRELVARVSGFGPLQPFLDDPEVEEIWINDPSRVFIARNGRHELTNLMLTSAQVDELRAGSKSSGLEQDVQVSGRFLRLALRAARPVMVWNHERMMRGCLAGCMFGSTPVPPRIEPRVSCRPPQSVGQASCWFRLRVLFHSRSSGRSPRA